MQAELVQTGASGLCALAIFKYQDVSSFLGEQRPFWIEENNWAGSPISCSILPLSGTRR